MNNNTDPKIQEIRKAVEFNYLWWGAAFEGEELCQDELENVKELVRYAKLLLSEYDRLTNVLRWYADKDNYDPVHLDTFGYIPIDKDEGKRAMAAISHIERITPIRP